jgi:hypothetical protein
MVHDNPLHSGSDFSIKDNVDMKMTGLFELLCKLFNKSESTAVTMRHSEVISVHRDNTQGLFPAFTCKK